MLSLDIPSGRAVPAPSCCIAPISDTGCEVAGVLPATTPELDGGAALVSLECGARCPSLFSDAAREWTELFLRVLNPRPRGSYSGMSCCVSGCGKGRGFLERSWDAGAEG